MSNRDILEQANPWDIHQEQASKPDNITSGGSDAGASNVIETIK
jgi:hypothetical protein